MTRIKTYIPSKNGRRMLQVQEHVRCLAEPTSASAIAQTLGLAISTLMSDLIVLEEEGYVNRIGDTLYQPTAKFAKWKAEHRMKLQSEIYERERELKEID